MANTSLPLQLGLDPDTDFAGGGGGADRNAQDRDLTVLGTTLA